MTFSPTSGYWGDWIWDAFLTNLVGGVVLAVAAPLALRLVYEIILMFILLVKNVIEINKKLKAPETPADEAPVVEVEEIIPEAEEVVIAEEIAPEVEEAPEENEEGEEAVIKLETSFEIGEPEEETTEE